MIERSSDLAGWEHLKGVWQTAETNLVADPFEGTEPHRFYRARLAP